MYPRLLSPPKLSFFLLGMRGTGKSFWSREVFPHAARFDLLDEARFQRYLVRPELFAEELASLPPGSWAVVDEIQRLPQLLNEVHRAIEERRLKFALLGSSARKLRRSGVNLLGGRAGQQIMYPLLPSELGSDFSLKNVLRFGSLPLVVASEAPAEQLEAYVQLYLKEEIQNEALVRNLPGFARFLPVASLFHAQTLSVASLARDAGIARTTAEGYLEILEDTLICFRLPAFEGKLRVKERKHPKWYWIDSGMVRAAKGTLAPPAPEEAGVLLEGFVAMLLRAGKDLKFCPYDHIAYWSPPSADTEVDFLVSRGKEFIAIEVKAAVEPANPHLKGLRAIADLGGLKRRILVYPGKVNRKTADGIEVLGIDTFIKLVQEGL